MSNLKVYVTSDTHFGHRRILEFEAEARKGYKDIFHHDWDLVQRWNSVVRPHDTVWHLGDVFFGGKDSYHAKEVLGALAGYKRLVLGNHDVNREDILREFFPRIYGAAEYGKCILTHIPVHPYQLEKRYLKNIHGHMHSKRVMHNHPNGDVKPDVRYTCVSVEHTNLTPVLLQHVIQHGID